MKQLAARCVSLTSLCWLAACDEATLSFFPLQAEPALPAQRGPAPDNAWALDGDALDQQGDNHGSSQGQVAYELDPVRGNVLHCNGLDSAVIVQNRTSLDFSYAAWIWTDVPSRIGSTAIDGDALLWSNVTGLEDDFTLALLNDRLSYMSYSMPATGTRSLVDGVWHHIALTRPDAGRVALYVDGELDGDGNSGSGDVLGNPSIYFCGNPEQGGYFNGKLDDVRFYARALEPSEVRALYDATRL